MWSSYWFSYGRGLLLLAVVKVQIGGRDIQVEQVLAPSQVKGSRSDGHMLTLQENVGDILAAEGFEGDGVFDGPGDLVWAIDLAQGDDLLDMMGSIESFILEFAAKQFGLRREIEEGQQQRLIACLFPLR